MSLVKSAIIVSPWPGGEFFVTASALVENGDMPYAVLTSESALREFIEVKMQLDTCVIENIMRSMRKYQTFTGFDQMSDLGLDAIRQNHTERTGERSKIAGHGSP